MENPLNKQNDLSLKYPIPRRLTNKYFFGLSVVDMVIIISIFSFCNGVLTKILEPVISDIPRMMWINYFPSVFAYMILREDKNSAESISDVLGDMFKFLFSSKIYEYKGKGDI